MAPSRASSDARRRVRIMGAPVTALSEADAVGSILDAATTRRGSWTITANLDHLRRYRREPLVRALIENADLVLADGDTPAVGDRLAGARLPERVAGSNMIWSISEAASQRRASVFLLGGEPGVADRAARVLLAQYAGLAVAGTLCPPVGFESDAEELAHISQRLVSAAPQIVFVALGFPKQDLLIGRLRALLPYVSFIGVGIAFSFVAGDLRRAPAWSQRLGLEWVYRLAQEPRRLASRYLARACRSPSGCFSAPPPSGCAWTVRTGWTAPTRPRQRSTDSA